VLAGYQLRHWHTATLVGWVQQLLQSTVHSGTRAAQQQGQSVVSARHGSRARCGSSSSSSTISSSSTSSGHDQQQYQQQQQQQQQHQ